MSESNELTDAVTELTVPAEAHLEAIMPADVEVGRVYWLVYNDGTRSKSPVAIAEAGIDSGCNPYVVVMYPHDPRNAGARITFADDSAAYFLPAEAIVPDDVYEPEVPAFLGGIGNLLGAGALTSAMALANLMPAIALGWKTCVELEWLCVRDLREVAPELADNLDRLVATVEGLQ